MSKALANPKLFAATGLLFAVATLINLSSTSTENRGTNITIAPVHSTPIEVSTPIVPLDPNKATSARKL